MKYFHSMGFIRDQISKLLRLGFIGVFLLYPLVPLAQSGDSAHRGTRYIVVLRHGDSQSIEFDERVARAGGERLKNLDLIGARAIRLPSATALERLREDPAVLRVDPDVEVTTMAHKTTTQASAQVLPWGIDRVDADAVWSTTTGAGVKVGIIDTGIDLKHPDLIQNVRGGSNMIYPWRSPNDDNGHGTHVAGTVAAARNSIGVVGMGPSINLYAIKVLDARGSGYLSDVIEGIQWAVANGMQVVNMSLGTSADVQSLHDAVIAAANAGVVVVAAAGNSGGSVAYPGAYPEAIAVSATDQSNTIAYFSSRGSEVDLAAPGVSIYSTYRGSRYATLSGTSMATPHVTGAAALLLTQPVGARDGNGNGRWDPDEIQATLESSATDLGSPGVDTLYGWGLLNIAAALN